MKNECEDILKSVGDHQSPQKKVEKGERVACEFYDASYNQYPPDTIFATSVAEIEEEQDLAAQKRFDEIKVRRKYLWVIINKTLIMAPERTSADSERGCICHTNLTAGNDAIIGGELWFLKDGAESFVLYLNFDSGRYKTVNAGIQHRAVLELFDCIGYKRVELFKG